MDLTKIKPSRHMVFIEAAVEPEKTESGLLYLPLEIAERYPQAGFVRAVGRVDEDIRVGDFAVLLREGVDIGKTYWQVCYLKLKDWKERELCDVEIEPVIREAVSAYLANPSTADHTIHVETVDGSKLSFLCSDVLDYGIEEPDNPMIKLDYVPVTLLHFWENGLERLFYFVHEDNIMLTVEIPDIFSQTYEPANEDARENPEQQHSDPPSPAEDLRSGGDPISGGINQENERPDPSSGPRSS